MKVAITEEPLFVDITCEKGDDLVGVEVQERPHGKQILYVCVNGSTLLRINRIPKLEPVGFEPDSEKSQNERTTEKSYKQRMQDHFQSENATEQDWKLLGQVFFSTTFLARHVDSEEMPVMAKVILDDLNLNQLLEFNKKVNIK